MTEWLIVVDCKSIGLSYVGSNPTLFIIKIRNITQFGSVPVLGIGRHVFKSHYFEKILFIQILK